MTGADWRKVKLGEICSFKYGQMPKKSELAEKGYPVFSGYRVVGYSPKYHYRDPEIIVVARGVGGTGDIKMSPSFCFLTNLSIATLVESPDVHKPFLFYRLAGTKLWDLRTGSAQAQITIERLREYEVSVPSLPVQRRIAGILLAYDELIEKDQRRIKILEAMARSLYREWFVHFRFPGHDKVKMVPSSLGPIPQGWEVVPFTTIADVLSGGTPKTELSEYWNGSIPFFTPRDAPACFYVQDTDKHVTELGLSKCASELYAPDTVFITARGTVGKIALPSVPMAMNQSCYALRGRAGIPQRFLFLMTLQQVGYLKTNTGGATFDTIVVDTFHRMQVVKPRLDVIARFGSCTDAMFEAVNTLQQQTENLRRTRDLLLPRLLSGNLIS